MLLASSSLLVASCDETVASRSGAEPAPVVTWAQDVAPILAQRCVACHRDGELAPFALTSYESARDRAAAIASAVRERRMPPWGAGANEDSTCSPPIPYRDDPRLSAREVTTIVEWANGGAPRGSSSDAIERTLLEQKPPPSIDGGLELAPRVPFELQEDRDRFVCVVLDPPIAEGGWISGIEVVPDDRRVVHHAVVLADADGTMHSRADAQGRFECPGIPIGSERASVLGVWLPGSVPVSFPEGAALPVVAGTRLVLQMHYSAPGRLGARDATRVRLRMLASGDSPRYLVYNGAWGNNDGTLASGDGLQPGPSDPPTGATFFIPAGVSGHVETMRVTIPSPPEGVVAPEARILGLLPHAHFAAVRVSASIERREGSPICLVDDRFDAHWQRIYAYDAPLERLPILLPGDRIEVRCVYDNTLANARLATARAERRLPLSDMTYGERTTDEMCAVFPQLVFRLR